MAGLRNYAVSLHQALAPKGIYVGTLSIGILITKGDAEKDPDVIATRIYEMCEQRDRAEDVFPRGAVGVPPEVLAQLSS